jgi:hypothetical protein
MNFVSANSWQQRLSSVGCLRDCLRQRSVGSSSRIASSVCGTCAQYNACSRSWKTRCSETPAGPLSVYSPSCRHSCVETRPCCQALEGRHRHATAARARQSRRVSRDSPSKLHLESVVTHDIFDCSLLTQAKVSSIMSPVYRRHTLLDVTGKGERVLQPRHGPRPLVTVRPSLVRKSWKPLRSTG